MKAFIFFLLGVCLSALAFAEPMGVTRIPSIPLNRAVTLERLSLPGGRKLSQEFFLGKWTLVFFGFTRCSGTCPTTLARLRSSLESLHAEGRTNTRVLFVGIDPPQDNVERVASFVQPFGKKFYGSCGNFDDLKKFFEFFHTRLALYFDDAPAHSPYVYVVSPVGEYLGFTQADVSDLEMKQRLQSFFSKT